MGESTEDVEDVGVEGTFPSTSWRGRGTEAGDVVCAVDIVV